MDCIMDSDNSTTTPPAGKIRQCLCGRRMSSLQHDFHSLRVVCQRVDCETNSRCPDCAEVGDLAITNYVMHKPSLQGKLQSKHKLKETVSTPLVAVDSADVAVSDQPASLIPLLVSSDPPVPDDDSVQLLGVRSDIVGQVKCLFDSFAPSLEAHLTSIDRKFSQVILSSASDVTNNRDNVSQDVLNPSFSAPSAVARRSEPTPDRAPSVSFTGDLGTILGGPAAADAPSGGSSLPRLSFEDLLFTIRFFESSGSSVPDSFLESLRNVVVYSTEHSFAMGGASLADSITLFCSRLSDPVDPTPGPSLGGGSIIAFLFSLVGVSSSLSPFAAGADNMHSVEGSGSLGSRFVPPPPGFVCLSGFPSSSVSLLLLPFLL